MRQRAVPHALAALAIFAATLPARAEDCRPFPLATFDIADYATQIPVTINGQGYTFMVDTGGYLSTLSPGVAADLHLQPAPLEKGLEMYMSDGTILDQSVTVDDMQLGQSQTKAVRFILQPQQSRAGLEHFSGTLAPDFLHDFDLDFDFANRKLTLLSPEHCPGKAAYWTTGAVQIPFRTDLAHHIIVPVKLDGVQTIAIVDTGASHTVVSEELAKQAFHLAPGQGLTERPGATGNALVRYVHKFKVLELNGVEFDDLSIGILPDEMAKSTLAHHQFKMADRRPTGPAMNAYPVIIGLDMLRKTHLYVDYKNELIYISAASPASVQ